MWCHLILVSGDVRLDASELDADNVPADEEFDRVMNAPD